MYILHTPIDLFMGADIVVVFWEPAVTNRKTCSPKPNGCRACNGTTTRGRSDGRRYRGGVYPTTERRLLSGGATAVTALRWLSAIDTRVINDQVHRVITDNTFPLKRYPCPGWHGDKTRLSNSEFYQVKNNSSSKFSKLMGFLTTG